MTASNRPYTCIEFLGLELVSVSMEARLPADKLTYLKELGWINALRLLLKCKNWSIFSAHKSFFAPARFCDVLLVSLLNSGPDSSSFVLLPGSSTRRDLIWWKVFCEPWNGVRILSQLDPVGGRDLVVFLGLSGTHLGSLAVFVNMISSSRRPLHFCGLFFAGMISGLVTSFFFTAIIRI